MLLKIIVICILSMVYVHVVYQLKTCQDLEIYELTITTKQNLEDVCNLKQPIVFNYVDPKLTWQEDYLEYDVNVYDTKYVDVPLSLEKSIKLFKKEGHATFHNAEFLKETNLQKNYIDSDVLLRPPLVTSIYYDIMFGSENFITRLQYKNSCRNFFIVTQGTVTIKLSPPNKHIHEIKQYETQEFYSDLNPWTDTKLKFLSVSLTSGRMIFIPAYWWYSIKLEKDARISMFYYKTFMNTIATLPETCMGVLQRQNTLTKSLPSFG